MSERLGPPPESNALDHLQTAIRVGVSAVPFVGGPGAELVNVVVRPSLDRRMHAWTVKLGEMMHELSARLDGFDPRDLAGNELFLTAVVDATRIALGTHIEEKLTLLKGALESLALGESPGDFLAMRFLLFVEELGPEHFVVLAYARDPAAWFDAREIPKPNIYMGAPKAVMNDAQLGIDQPVLDVVLRDLSDRGLANTSSLGTMMSETGVWGPWATPLGRQLVDFVREF